MRRRDLLGFLAGGLALAPQATRSQPRLRRVGVLVGTGPEQQGQWRKDAIREGLQPYGWTEGQTIEVIYRWAEGRGEDVVRRYADELIATQPDVLFGTNTLAVKGLAAAASSIPIVFTNVTDPVGSGFAETLPRPGGNITGFTDMDPAIAGKWVELLKEVAPRIEQVAMMFNPETAPFAKPYFRAFENAGQQYGLSIRYATVETKDQYPATIQRCSQPPLTGLIVIDDGLFNRNKDRVIGLATEHRVPAIHNHAAYVRAGGLISYGVDIVALYRQTMSYIHRILSGEKPGELPIQMPTRYLTTVNTKAAEAIGIRLSASLLARADDLVEG